MSEYRAIIGLTILKKKSNGVEPFLEVGLTYEGLSDSHRQVIQDILLEAHGEVMAALTPVIHELNAVGQALLAGDAKYAEATRQRKG